MPTQSLTYDELATSWGTSREGARKKVEALRLPKKMGNDGKARVTIDLDEIQHQPLPKRDRKAGDRAEITALQGHVETLKAEIERISALAGAHRDDFERERQRADQAFSELVRITAMLADAEQDRAGKVTEIEEARAEGRASSIRAEQAQAELETWKQRSWWRRALG